MNPPWTKNASAGYLPPMQQHSRAGQGKRNLCQVVVQLLCIRVDLTVRELVFLEFFRVCKCEQLRALEAVLLYLELANSKIADA